MSSVSSARLPLNNVGGVETAVLQLHVLPKSRNAWPAPLLDLTEDLDRDPSLEPVQLLEATEYRFELLATDPRGGPFRLEPAEVFEADDDSGTQGRLKPGLATGQMTLQILDQLGKPRGAARVEIRSRKLDYLRHYRWMLRDITSVTTELVMERFAAAEQAFSVDDSRDAETLYQRFEFLRALLESDEFESSLHRIIAQPYVSWTTEQHDRNPQQGIRASQDVGRQIAAMGPRMNWPSGPPSLRTLPARLHVSRTESSVDNAANRFVKFALSRWRDIAQNVQQALAADANNAPTQRGAREVEAIIDRLDAWLSEQLFREVGDLAHFPANNQVLQKREGYRDVLRAYLQAEVAAKLSWPGGESVYSAGQRNVAALYEYWTYIQLASVVQRLCGNTTDLSQLVEVDARGMNVSLTRGRAASIGGTVERRGRRLNVTLWFNRTFSARGPKPDSWSRPMRPDATLHVSSQLADTVFQPTWVHFDAKYRIEGLSELMGTDPATPEEEQNSVDSTSRADDAGSPKRSDLLKMHAYRDAIKSTSGAYVLYPGDRDELRRSYEEILPGLGAFVLRPSETGEAQGTSNIYQFLDKVLDHFATQISEHERERYWTREVHTGEPGQQLAPIASFLTKPPDDTLVLLGYVRSEQQLNWIRRTGLYNLRAGQRRGAVGLRSQELAADLLVLYGPPLDSPQILRVGGEPRVLNREELVASGYHKPGGDLYFCLQVEQIDTDYRLSSASVTSAATAAGRPQGAPATVSWRTLVS